MQKRVSVVAAVAALALATWSFLYREGPIRVQEASEAEGVHAVGAEGEAATPRLAPAPAMGEERTAAPSSSSPTAVGNRPRAPTAPARPRIAGTAHLPEGEKASSWVVIWRRQGSRSAGTADIRDDGSFELPTSDPGSCSVALRPRTALWPALAPPKGAMAGNGMVLEPEALSAFRVRVEGDLPGDRPTAVQVESMEGAPVLQLAVTADRPEIEVAGIER